MQSGQTNQGSEPDPWDNENARQEEVEEERVFYTRPPSPPPRPTPQHHFYPCEPHMPRNLSPTPRRPLFGRGGGPRGRGRGGSGPNFPHFPQRRGRVGPPVVPPRVSPRMTGLPPQRRALPPSARRGPFRHPSPVQPHPLPPKPAQLPRRPDSHPLPPKPVQLPRRPDSRFSRARPMRTGGQYQRPQPMVAQEARARDNRVERQRTLDEYRIPFKSFDEQWPTRSRTKELMIVHENPKYSPFSRRPITRDIRSVMFRERWKATNSAGATSATAILIDDSDSDSDSNTDIPALRTSSIPSSPLFTPPRTPPLQMTPAPRPRQVARKMPIVQTISSVSPGPTHETSEGEISEDGLLDSASSSSSSTEAERDHAIPPQPTQEESMPEKLRELLRSLTHNALEHYNRRRIPLLTRNLKQSFANRYKQKFGQPKVDQHSVRWVRYIFCWFSENGEEQEWSYREEGRAGLECPFCPFWGEFATRDIFEAHFKDNGLGVHHDVGVEFDGKEEEGSWEVIIWLDKSHGIPNIVKKELPASTQIIVKPEPHPDTTDDFSVHFSSLRLLENAFPTSHNYGPLGLMGPIYHWRRRDLLNYGELSEAAKRLHGLWATYHASRCDQFVVDPVSEIEVFLNKYWESFYSPAHTFRQETLNWILEIKQSLKLEQIQLLDLIDFFDRRADSRQHEPSPEL